MVNSYLSILRQLSNKQIKYIVAGGVACVLHGVERVTMGIDLSLLMSEENIKSFLIVMKDLGMIPRAPVPAEFLLSEDNRRIMREEKGALVFSFWNPTDPLLVVDVFLSENHSYEELNKDAIKISLEEIEIQIISLDKIIAIKESIIPPRSKDIFDLQVLMEIRGKNING